MKFIIKLLIILILFGVVWKMYDLSRFTEDGSFSLFKAKEKDSELTEEEILLNLEDIKKQVESGEIDEEAAKKGIEKNTKELFKLIKNGESDLDISFDDIKDSEYLNEKFNVKETSDSLSKTMDILNNIELEPSSK